MTDPREVGLPPIDAVPAFYANLAALRATRRRHSQRRLRQLALSGGAGAVVVATVVGLASVGGTSQAVLEHDLPPQQTTPSTPPVASAAPSPSPAPPAASAPTTAGGATARDPQPGEVFTRPTRPTYEASPWRRRTLANETCFDVSDWTATGWCLRQQLPAWVQSGRHAGLAVEVCRTALDDGQLHFPLAQQARVELWDPRTQRRVWTSAQRPSPFRAGERIVLAAGSCVRWSMMWTARSNGRPISPGTYEFRWTTGSDLRSSMGRTDYGVASVSVRR